MLSSAHVLLRRALSLSIRRPCLRRCDDGDGLVTFHGSASHFVKVFEPDLEWTLEALKDIVQGFTTNLAISEAEAFEIVCVEELSKLKADCFLLVGRLLTAKPFHKEALFGTIISGVHGRISLQSLWMHPRGFCSPLSLILIVKEC